MLRLAIFLSVSIFALGLGAAMAQHSWQEPGTQPALAEAESREPGAGDASPRDLSGRGLLDLRDPMPFAGLHLQLPLDTLEVMNAGQGKFELSLSWANSFLLEDTFVVDAETYRLTFGGWYALSDDFYVGAEVPVHARDSGVLDPVIDSFHNAFNFGEGDRSLRGRNEYEISIHEPGGAVAELDRGVGLGDLVLKSHWNVHPGARWYPAVSLEGLMGLPTSTSDFGSSGVDVGLALGFSKNVFDGLYLYAVLGGTYFTDSTTQGIHYEREGYQAVVGAEINLGKRVSLVLQSMNYTPLLERPTLLNRKRNYVAGGLKVEYLDGFTLDLSIVENLYPFTSSADIGLATNLGFKF